MSTVHERSARDTELFFEWVDIARPNRVRIDLVRRRLALPAKLTSLSLSRFLYPSIVSVPPASFLTTYFTAPSARDLFELHPLQFWLTDQAIVTVSPHRALRSAVTEQRRAGATWGAFLERVLEAAIVSHEDVVQGLNEAFFAPGVTTNPRDWHRKERRLTFFVRILEHQLRFMRDVDREVVRIGRLHDQLRGLCKIVRYASQKVRQLGACPLCSRLSQPRRARRPYP